MNLSEIKPLGVNTLLKMHEPETISNVIITEKTIKFVKADVVDVGEDVGNEIKAGDQVLLRADIANQLRIDPFVKEGSENDYRLVPIEYILGKFNKV